jgi:hypothetical protein
MGPRSRISLLFGDGLRISLLFGDGGRIWLLFGDGAGMTTCRPGWSAEGNLPEIQRGVLRGRGFTIERLATITVIHFLSGRPTISSKSFSRSLLSLDPGKMADSTLIRQAG